MSDDLRTRIAAVLYERFAAMVGFADAEWENVEQEPWLEDADVVIRELPELPAKITTTNELDALPFLTVIREVRNPDRNGMDYGGIYERRTSGWKCIAGTWVEPERNGGPLLPVMVLWRGKGESQ